MDTEDKPRTLLIIEDSHFQAKLLRKRIDIVDDYPIVTADSMKATEEILKQSAPDIFLALIDMNLPDAPNGEALDLCLDWKVPSLVLTASFNEETRSKCIKKPVLDYFFKGSSDDLDPLISSIDRAYKNQFITTLLVDDSRTQRAIVKKLLEIQRLNVLEAEHGEQALEILDQHPEIRLMVTDFQMPGMDGVQLAREARNRHRMENLAIIGISSVGSGPLTAKFLKSGASDFLTKPFEAEEFYWRVNQTLSTQEMLRTIKQIVN